MPPVFGPASPSPRRLWSRASGSARAVAAVAQGDEARLAAASRSSTTTRAPGVGARPSIAALGLGEVVADGHALAGGQPVGLDDDAAARPRPARGRTPAPARTSVNAPPRAIRTPAAAATSWQNALLLSIRAAAAVGPEDRDAGRGQRVGDAGRQRRLGPDDHELDGLAPGERDDRVGVERIDVARSAPAAPRAIASLPGRDDDLVDAGLRTELPGERVLPAAAADDRGSGSA